MNIGLCVSRQYGTGSHLGLPLVPFSDVYEQPAFNEGKKKMVSAYSTRLCMVLVSVES